MDKLAEGGVDKTYSCCAVDEARDYHLDFCCGMGEGGVCGAGPAGLAAGGLETGEVEELGAEFAGAEAHVVSPKELEADCFCTVILAFTKADSRFVLSVCAVFETNKRGVDLACCYTA